MVTRRILIIASLAIFLSMKMTALPKIVYDQKCIEAVGINTAYQNLAETSHNEMIDSIRIKQNSIMKYVTSMESMKELYKMSMQNVRGFGQESVYYRQIIENFSQIPLNTAEAVKAISRNPGINYINSLHEIVNIQAEVVSLIKTFVDIVNNGKIDFSAFTSGKNNDQFSVFLKNAHLGQGDGYNFIDRYQRLTLANDILSHLEEVNTRLYQIKCICEYCSTFSNLLYNIDPVTWASFFTGKNIVDNIIHSWNDQV